jgi:hypothetical protein
MVQLAREGAWGRTHRPDLMKKVWHDASTGSWHIGGSTLVSGDLLEFNASELLRLIAEATRSSGGPTGFTQPGHSWTSAGRHAAAHSGIARQRVRDSADAVSRRGVRASAVTHHLFAISAALALAWHLAVCARPTRPERLQHDRRAKRTR